MNESPNLTLLPDSKEFMNRPKQEDNQCHKFSDFAKADSHLYLDGEKMKIMDILNREIVIRKYQITPSKYNDKSVECLKLQFTFPGEEKHYVVFTGSRIIASQMRENADGNMPFLTTIIKRDRCFKLT
jgi:hypothetical protein